MILSEGHEQGERRVESVSKGIRESCVLVANSEIGGEKSWCYQARVSSLLKYCCTRVSRILLQGSLFNLHTCSSSFFEQLL